MKRFLKVLLVVVVLSLAIVACSPAPTAVQTSSAVQIDPALKLLFEGLLITLFTAGTIYIFERTGLDLKQFAIPVAVSFSTFLVGALQNWINFQPIELDPWIALGLRIVGALLAGFGALRLFSKQPATLLAR